MAAGRDPGGPGAPWYAHAPERTHEVAVFNALILAMHLIASGLLIVFILLHAGRGGGLSDMFGGGMGGSLAGSTVVERNLDRITVLTAIVFGFTTILLGLRL